MRALRKSSLFISISIFFMLFSLIFFRTMHSQAAQKQSAVPAVPESGASPADYQTLFPTLDGRSIVSLHVRTPDTAFDFIGSPAHSVSVNGNRADTEIYLTLLSQIRSLPVSAHPAFTSESKPVMTLTISTDDGMQHVARFYSSDGNSELTRIVSGPAESPTYHQTDAWRIGTLMMTCEGTRIQDERGNETPAVRP